MTPASRTCCLLPLAAVLLGTAAESQAGDAPGPRVWMCRKDPWELGRKPEQWPFVARHCDVLTLYVDQVAAADIDDLRALASVIRDRDLLVAIECAGLCDWRAAAGDRAAELSFADEFRKVKRFLDPVAAGGAGGRIDYLQMDGPFRRMLYRHVPKEPPTRPGYHTIDTAGDQLVRVMRLWREAVPGIEFYLLTNFPNWGYRDYPGYHSWDFTGQGTKGLGDYAEILETAARKTADAGIPVRGITVDNPYDYATGEFGSNQPGVTRDTDWIVRLLDLEKDVEERGLEFGLIFNSSKSGGEKTGSDEAYRADTLAYLDLYLKRGGSPANVIVQSWYDRPLALVPESRPESMTGLTRDVILRVKPRTRAEPTPE